MFRRRLYRGTSEINGGGESVESVVFGFGARRDWVWVPDDGGVTEDVLEADGTGGS